MRSEARGFTVGKARSKAVAGVAWARKPRLLPHLRQGVVDQDFPTAARKLR